MAGFEKACAPSAPPQLGPSGFRSSGGFPNRRYPQRWLARSSSPAGTRGRHSDNRGPGVSEARPVRHGRKGQQVERRRGKYASPAEAGVWRS